MNPDRDGYWTVVFKTSDMVYHAMVCLRRNEVFLPFGEAPYRLTDLPEGEWIFVSNILPEGW